MAEQDALDGVVKADVPGELAEFADVVEDDAGDEQVAVEERIVGGDFVSEGEQADDVLKQAAEPGVMKLARGGGFTIGLRRGRGRRGLRRAGA